MRTTTSAVLLVSLVIVGLLVSTTWAQLPPLYIGMSQDGTPIPDVDKPAINPPNGIDASCWLASASNILAAAGYGSGGGPAQMRAQNIYNQLTFDYGTTVGGATDQAISYWLATYGKNPNSPEYLPNLAYTDVTAEYRALGATDYVFLKNELYDDPMVPDDTQYVGVLFESPAHAVTLVGWDDNLNQSIWHDSDWDVPVLGNDDDSYNNAFTASPVDWDLVDPATGTTYLDHANGYVTFCPGLNKTEELVANYDVAYSPSPNGPAIREAGLMAGIYDSVLMPPYGWQGTQWTDPNDPSAVFDPFLIDNEFDPLKQKHIELLVDFYGRDANYANEDIRVRYQDEHGMEVVMLPSSTTLSADNGQVLFTWELDIQPEWEEVLFPSYLDYGLLEGTVASWDVAMICVPEPSTFVLVAFGLLALRSRRRRA